MITKKSLEARIRGWFPQEPRFPNKPLQIKLETNPLKLKQLKAKFTINIAQFIAVVLAVSLILSGLYLNSISNEKSSYDLPIEWTGRHETFDYNGTGYNCSINLFISPPLVQFGSGVANDLAPFYVYLNEPSNLTSGIYFASLRYVRYNDTLNVYVPQESTETGTFSPSQNEKQVPVYRGIYLHPPFEGDSKDPIVKDFVFTVYSNTTGQLPLHSPLFTVTTPIDLTHSDFIVTYPYRNIGNTLLSIGIVSLIVVLAISLVNLLRRPNDYPAKAASYQEPRA